MISFRKLPSLDHGRHWFVVESLRHNRDTDRRFRVFEAAIGHSKDEALKHVELSDERLDITLKDNAVKRGEIEIVEEWKPYSTLVRYLSIIRVRTEVDIARRDLLLLLMPHDHGFFVDDLSRDPSSVIGGGIHDYE